MALVRPSPGLVIRYAFLWRAESERNATEGKDRPCVVILAVRLQADGRMRVRVAPITHTPKTAENGIEIPSKIGRHLGLDGAASWISLTDANEFVWPGPDIRPIPGRRGAWSYGILPTDFFDELKRRIAQTPRPKPVLRD
jgi:hypothetical protein